MTCYSVNFSTTNSTWHILGLKLGLCGERLESIQLSRGMDVHISGISIMDIKSNVIQY